MASSEESRGGETGSPEDLRRELEQSVAEDRLRADPTVRESTATCRINIEPAAIPRVSADPAKMLAAVQSEFSSSLDTSDFLRRVPPEARGSFTAPSVFSFSVANDEIVKFSGGRIVLTDADQVTPIITFGFGEQTLHASVNGRSDVAEYLCKRLCLMLWEASGITGRKWSELEPGVELISYQTSTLVEFQIPMIKMLSGGFQRFLAEDLPGGDGHARNMGRYAFRVAAESAGFEPIVVPYVRELDLRVVVIDPVSGESDDCSLHLLMHSRGDANRSRVKVLSELPSDKHNSMVAALAGALI